MYEKFQSKTSIEKPPQVELKPLPEHLKYLYLGESETLVVIISTSLDADQEDRLVRMLKMHKEAIS